MKSSWTLHATRKTTLDGLIQILQLYQQQNPMINIEDTIQIVQNCTQDSFSFNYPFKTIYYYEKSNELIIFGIYFVIYQNDNDQILADYCIGEKTISNTSSLISNGIAGTLGLIALGTGRYYIAMGIFTMIGLVYYVNTRKTNMKINYEEQIQSFEAELKKYGIIMEKLNNHLFDAY